MRKVLFLLMLFFVNLFAFSQTKGNLHIQSGQFICKANRYMIYMENEQDDSEELSYTINALNLNNNEKTIIGKQLRAKCINLHDTAVLYPNGSNLILWNLERKGKTIFYKSDKNMSILGVVYNKQTSCLLIVQINLDTKELFVKVLNDAKKIIFCQKVNVNKMEMEGILPSLNILDDFFVLLIQDKLYTIDGKRLHIRHVSSKCDGYALSKDEIIYYKFITDEKTEGYSINLITNENKRIDNSLNEKVYNCVKPFLFTANICNVLIPTYTICDKVYLWSNNKWQISPEVICI